MNALTQMVELPTVIDTANRIVLDPTEVQWCAPMRATVGDDQRRAGLPPIKGVVFAHDADGFDVSHRQILTSIDSVPELAHEYSARCSGACGSDVEALLRTVCPKRRTRFHEPH